MKRNVRRVGTSTRTLTRGALIASLYVGLTYISTIFGLSSGAIQFRISEALCILPIFMPEAVVGLWLGCLISNLIMASAVWDIIFGSLATLIGAYGAYLLRKCPEKLKLLTTLPTVAANALIVPLVLIYAYGATEGYFFILGTVTLVEVLSATLLGTLLYYGMKRVKLEKYL